MGPFLRVNEWVWSRLPSSCTAFRPISLYVNFLHSLVKIGAERTQYHGTFFFRNRPELELIRSLATKRPCSGNWKIIVFACSNGAEVYSILWTIRSARPDLMLDVHAVDISKDILEIARQGRYSPQDNPLVHSDILERLTKTEIAELFEKEDNQLRIKPWIAHGLNWHLGDARDSDLAEVIGQADIVVANKFLCHMAPRDAERCLRNVASFVRPGGYLFVSGVDLEVRTEVAVDLGWNPLPDLLEEIHDGDPSVRRDWPWKYWGLEPFDRRRPDWKKRYAAVFRLGSPGETRDEVCVHDNAQKMRKLRQLSMREHPRNGIF